MKEILNCRKSAQIISSTYGSERIFYDLETSGKMKAFRHTFRSHRWLAIVNMGYGITKRFVAWIWKKFESFFTLSLDSICDLLKFCKLLSTSMVYYSRDVSYFSDGVNEENTAHFGCEKTPNQPTRSFVG